MSKDGLEEASRLHLDGKLAEAAALYERLLSRDSSDPEIHRRLGVARLQLGDLVAAEKSLRRAEALAPHSLQVVGDIGALRLAQRRYRDAVRLLEGVLQRSPDHADALNHCAIAWTEMGQLERALPLFERLARIRPDSPAAFRLLGDTQYKLGQHEDAIASLVRAVEIDPGDRQARLALGDAYESVGRKRDARAQYLALLRRNPDSPLAIARLLMLAGQEVETGWVSKAAEMADSVSLPAETRARVAIGLAHHHEGAGRYEEAFNWIERGNELLRQQRPYDVGRFEAAVDRLIEVFSREQIEELRSRYSSPIERPIFIVGMPRSGTTLVEQMLASHSSVAAGGELSTMLNVAARVRGLVSSAVDYPYAVRDLGAQQLQRLVDFYLARLDRVSTHAVRVTDKLPFNFMHIGLISVLFPRASIVHCRRDPLDTCVSCYFTGFSEQIRFASQQSTLGRYYRQYARLMRHWRAVAPERSFDVQYEELAAQPEPVLRALVEHCGLAWEAGCLAFHDSERSIRTPSRWQVRRPISTSSIGRWKRYEPWIGPLRQALGEIS